MPSSPSTAMVLVVDDDPPSRLFLEALLKRSGFRVTLADSARHALARLHEDGSDAYEAVITDYWMPGGSGVDLIRQVQAEDPTLSFILATAAGEKDILAEVLRSGGCDYLDKPIRWPRLEAALQRALARTRAQRQQRATTAAARALGLSQERLLRRHTSRLGERIQLFFHSHSEASGDFLSVFPIDDRRLVLLVSDASGHDLSSAFHANYFHGIARGMIARHAPVREVFEHFNELLLHDWSRDGEVDISLAAAGLVVDSGQGRLEIMNCGFPPPLVADAAGWWVNRHGEQSGSPLGWFADLPPPGHHAFRDGTITLWSDGLTDLAAEREVDPLCLTHRLLGDAGNPSPILQGAKDDLLTARVRLGATDRPFAIPLIAQHYHGGQAGGIDRIQEFIDRSIRLARIGLPDDRLADLMVCARETLLNALLHGCRGNPALQVLLQLVFDPATGALRLRVTDPGNGHDFDVASHATAAAEHLLTEHRGLVMVNSLSDRISSSGRGADVTMDFLI